MTLQGFSLPIQWYRHQAEGLTANGVRVFAFTPSTTALALPTKPIITTKLRRRDKASNVNETICVLITVFRYCFKKASLTVEPFMEPVMQPSHINLRRALL